MEKCVIELSYETFMKPFLGNNFSMLKHEKNRLRNIGVVWYINNTAMIPHLHLSSNTMS